MKQGFLESYQCIPPISGYTFASLARGPISATGSLQATGPPLLLAPTQATWPWSLPPVP